MNLPRTWISFAAWGVAKRLSIAQDVSFRFGNFVRRELFIRLILFETVSAKIGRLFYLSHLFLLRVPSEGLPIRRAFSTDIITTKSPQEVKAPIAVRASGDNLRLILQIKKRKLNKTGAATLRPCFCDGEWMGPSSLCPIRDIRPLVRRSSLPGDQLFPNIQWWNLNRKSNAILGNMGVESSSGFPTNAFRRGAATDTMESGPTIDQITRSAGRHSQAFRAYLISQVEGGETRNLFPHSTSLTNGRRRKSRPPRSPRQGDRIY